MEGEPLSVKIPVGEEGQDYQGGNLLNAIDDLVCWFIHHRNMDEEDVAEHLSLYAERMKR